MLRIFLLVVLLIASSTLSARSYRIELLAFAVGDSNNEEFWPENPGIPDQSLAQAVLTGTGGHGKATRLSTDALLLGPEAFTVRKFGMPPVLHIAWVQPVHGRNKKDWFWVDSGNLRGLVSVTRGRYLHLDVDLVYQDQGKPIRIRAHRRMRSRELHYLDHPRLGLLSKIWPVK